jgi:hypothetical protein
MTAVDRFGVQLAELRETLLAMPEDQRLAAVFANDVELLRFYFDIAALNRFFHECAEAGTLPIRDRGHA